MFYDLKAWFDPWNSNQRVSILKSHKNSKNFVFKILLSLQSHEISLFTSFRFHFDSLQNLFLFSITNIVRIKNIQSTCCTTFFCFRFVLQTIFLITSFCFFLSCCFFDVDLQNNSNKKPFLTLFNNFYPYWNWKIFIKKNLQKLLEACITVKVNKSLEEEKFSVVFSFCSTVVQRFLFSVLLADLSEIFVSFLVFGGFVDNFKLDYCMMNWWEVLIVIKLVFWSVIVRHTDRRTLVYWIELKSCSRKSSRDFR